MTTQELKEKYPESTEMIDNLEGYSFMHEIRGDKTVHAIGDGTYFYNYQGIHAREFESLEHLIKWFFGTVEEQEEAENKIKNFGYSSYLSNIVDAEVWLDDNDNVSKRYCDFTNKDFTKEQLEKARQED